MLTSLSQPLRRREAKGPSDKQKTELLVPWELQTFPSDHHSYL
ncbi:hypothetical protein Hdeb2414_s0017g00503861 [Helianthus debilis subsp. tardiflorus]